MARLSSNKSSSRKSSQEINSSSSSSSKILDVVRQALLNAAQELIAQQKIDPTNLSCSPIDANQSSQKNTNAVSKKKRKKPQSRRK